MAWEWSHTQEAYDNVRDNLDKLNYEDIRVIWSEVKTYQYLNPDNDFMLTNDFDESVYDSIYEDSKYQYPEVMVSNIWDFMQEFRTCTNGGFYAYACPYGCKSHLISFDKM